MNKYTPKTALNTTAEKVLNRSNKPNTAFGITPVPIAPLIIAEAARSGPVTNLTIPKFCLTEVTDQPRFSNESLAASPFSRWAGEFEAELSEKGPSFQQVFGTNKMGD